MTENTSSKECLTCGKGLKGRADKKFCDDYCRNSYNKQLKSIVNNQVRDINKTLDKNQRILQSLLPETEETAKVKKEKLDRLGFQFKYITHMHTTKSGKTYYYCYDHGYTPLDHDSYLIVRRKEKQ